MGSRFLITIVLGSLLCGAAGYLIASRSERGDQAVAAAGPAATPLPPKPAAPAEGTPEVQGPAWWVDGVKRLVARLDEERRQGTHAAAGGGECHDGGCWVFLDVYTFRGADVAKDAAASAGLLEHFAAIAKELWTGDRNQIATVLVEVPPGEAASLAVGMLPPAPGKSGPLEEVKARMARRLQDFVNGSEELQPQGPPPRDPRVQPAPECRRLCERGVAECKVLEDTLDNCTYECSGAVQFGEMPRERVAACAAVPCDQLEVCLDGEVAPVAECRRFCGRAVDECKVLPETIDQCVANCSRSVRDGDLTEARVGSCVASACDQLESCLGGG